jgi:signal transduction histidine kinase
MPNARTTFFTLLLLAIGLALRAPAGAAPPTGPITTAAGVRALTATAAAEARPVRLEGVVLTAIDWPAFVLRDATDGVYVTVPAATPDFLQPGAHVAIEGVTGPGNFAPMVRATAVRHLGTRPLPTPMHTTLTEVAGGGFDAKWVEVEGIVRSCVVSPIGPSGFEEPEPPAGGRAAPRLSSFLTLASGDIQLRVKVTAVLDPAAVVDARVRLRGVCFNVHNANRQFVRASLRVAAAEHLEVIERPPVDPFALPLQRAEQLLQFDPRGFTGHRVRVRGTVTWHQPGSALWIRDGRRGLRIVSAQAGEIAPGDEVEVAGFIERGRYSPSLIDAVFRRRARGAPPAPIAMARFSDVIAHDADLVALDAGLQDIRPGSEGLLLTLDWDGTPVEALLPIAAGGKADAWEPGSRLRLTGLCALAPGGTVPDNGLWTVQRLLLLLRDAEDIRVVRPAPWFNSRRATRLTILLAGGLAAVLVVLWAHSRRQLAQRELARKMAETEFAAILGERNRVARDIHDTLAQGLNAVSMQLELARNAAGKGTEAVLPHVATAHRIVRSCLADARESIWNMRSHVLEKTDLAGALGSVLRQMSEGLPVTARLEVAGESRRLPPQVENDLLRIGQEAIANALKHAGAAHLTVCLEFTPAAVGLQISDDGRGFNPEAARDAVSRFGLKGMQERAGQMAARLRITSAPDQGTEVRIEVALPDAPGRPPARV